MSTRKPLPGQQPGCHRGSATRSPYLRNPTSLPEEIARIATARRELLLRAHRFRLRREDLEDAYSQAVFELVMAARRGGRYIDRRHIGHALEQRFISRIHDRRRALSGRSPIQTALETARQLGSGHDEGTELVDVRAEVERLVILRAELRQVAKLASKLTPDQRLVLACQVGLQMSSAAFCRRYGWSPEKYRKVAQRARQRLRQLRDCDDGDVPSAGRASEGGSRTC